MKLTWLRKRIKRRFHLYDIEDLRAGGWCGCCGKWLPNVVVPAYWPYTICPDWETSPRHALEKENWSEKEVSNE